jgi:hypothetical protein
MDPIKKFQTFTYLQDEYDDKRRTEIQDNHDNHNSHDPEFHMLTSQLENIIENAEELIKMVEGRDRIEDWIQSKISIADDYIEVARNYYKHR